MGCGSGRWAKVMAQKVGTLHCIDASHVALAEARKNLSQFNNCHFECASVADVSIEDASQDFGYCLGVLHHIPDTQAGLKSCADKLKSGAPFLLYLYYKLENKPWWFQKIWRFSDLFRQFICQLPFGIKHWLCQLIALIVYWPLSRASLLLEKLGFNVDDIPLSAYRNKSLYFLRTDALDRFGTKREARFTKGEIASMMRVAGFKDISFSDKTPYWVAVGIKA